MPFNSKELAFGHYEATYDGNDMGLIEGVRRVQQTAEGIDIRADQYGSSVIDGIYTGANMFLLMTVKEWIQANPSVASPEWPFGEMGNSGVHGRSYYDLSKQIILTAVDGTTAKTFGPTTRTIPKCIYSPGHNSEHRLGNEERDILIVFRIYPQDESGSPFDSLLGWYTDVNT